MYHFFVSPDMVDEVLGTVTITGSDVNHIRNVLRMKSGDELLLSDGQGHDYHCVIAEDSTSSESRRAGADAEVVCDIVSGASSLAEPSVKFYLFQGLPKADKFEHIIQKAVELGAFEIIPVKTARSIVKYDDKKARAKTERWQKIAESAAKQSRRGIIPVVREIMSFKEAVAFASEGEERLSMNIIPYENFKDMKATRDILQGIGPGMSVGIFVGPEGGFEEEEVSLANAAGIQCISLGNRILRTETAPLMLLSVLTFRLE